MARRRRKKGRHQTDRKPAVPKPRSAGRQPPKPAGYHWDRAEPVTYPDGRRGCRWCKRPVAPPKRNWCGDPACVRAWKIRTDPATFRAAVFERDRGVCSACGLDATAYDVAAIQRAMAASVDAQIAARSANRRVAARAAGVEVRPVSEWLKRLAAALRWRREHRVKVRDSAWEAHHTRAIVDGGDWFDLDRVATVCAPCHRKLTAELNARLARERRASGVRPPVSKPRKSPRKKPARRRPR